jgi:hypothetical protein
LRPSQPSRLGRIGRLLLSVAVTASALVGFAITQAPAAHASGGGLSIYWKNEAGATTSLSHTAFTTGTCATATSNIGFNWASGSPSGCNVDGFTTYATGYISAFNGANSVTEYFCDQSDDGFYLLINGSAVIDNWVEQGASTTCNSTGSFTFAANTVYTIQVWHHENLGSADMRLLWNTSASNYSIIPAANLGTSASQLIPSSNLQATMPTITYGQTSYTSSGYVTGGTSPYTYSISSGSLPSLLSLNTSTGALTYNTSGTVSAGTYNFTVRATDANSMYVNSASQIQVLKVPIAVTASAATRQYGYANSLTGYTYVGVLQYSDTFTVSETSTATAASNVGSYSIYPTMNFTNLGSECASNASNCYTIALYAGTLTVNKRAITIKSNNANKNFGSLDPTITGYTLSGDGLYSTDTFTITASRAVGETVDGSPYAITPAIATFANASNYTVTLQTGNLTVSAQPAALLVGANSPSPSTITYTGSPVVLNKSYFVNNQQPLDTVTAVTYGYFSTSVNDGSTWGTSTRGGQISSAPTKAGTYKVAIYSYALTQPDPSYHNYQSSSCFGTCPPPWLDSEIGTFTISRATPTLSLSYPNSNTATYYPNETLTATYSIGNSDGTVTWTSTSLTVCTVSNSTGVVSVLTAGACGITLSTARGNNYESSTVSVSITINKATRTITATPATSTAKFASTDQLTATPSAGISDGTISYNTSTSSLCTIDSSGLILVKASSGTCSVTATIAEGTNYLTATSSAATVTLAKADTLTITATSPSTFTYSPGMSIPANSYSISGLPSSETITSLSYTYSVSAISCASGGTCSLGDTGPGGGMVFYVSGNTYYEAAPKTWYTSVTYGGSTYANQNVYFCANASQAQINPNNPPGNTTGTGWGGGISNTANFASYCAGGAFGLVKAYAGGSKADWYLPDITEMNGLVNYFSTYSTLSAEFPSTTSGSYWTSEASYNGASYPEWLITNPYFNSGVWSGGGSAYNHQGGLVLPIRKFSSIGASGIVINNLPASAGSFAITPSGASFTFGSASDFTNVVYTSGSLVINKATQSLLRVNNLSTLFFDQIKNTAFTLSAVGGTDTGTATFAFSNGPNTTCSMPNSTSIISTTTGTCLVSVTKAATINYLSATSDTATVSFIEFLIPYFAPVYGSGAIALPYTPPAPKIDPDMTPTFSSGSFSARANATLTISGSGFTGIIEVDFDSGEAVMVTPGSDTTITLTVPSTAQSGPVILVKTRSNGSQLFARTNFILLP